jgi:FKBP-type peptidyl-prolyl cis-trans isomerase FkpA
MRFLALLMCGTLVVILGCGAAGKPATELKSEDDKTLYALGVSMGGNLKTLGLSAAEIAAVQAGLADGASGTKPQVELETYGPKIRELAQARAAKGAQAEKDKGQAYVDKAAGETGAKKTASGMVYIQVQEGTGASPTAADAVKVHYRGTLTDGTEFDSSYKRNEPVDFPLGQVIPCWTEGLQMMKAGGKAKLVCPAAIAYGDNGRPPVIPGGATLVFEVELLNVNKGGAAAAPPAAHQR